MLSGSRLQVFIKSLFSDWLSDDDRVLIMLARRLQGADSTPSVNHREFLPQVMGIEVYFGKLLLLNSPGN